MKLISSNVNFPKAVSRDVDVIDSVLELASHLISVLVEWLLNLVLVIPGDALFHPLPDEVLHHLIEILFPHSKRLNVLDSR